MRRSRQPGEGALEESGAGHRHRVNTDEDQHRPVEYRIVRSVSEAGLVHELNGLAEDAWHVVGLTTVAGRGDGSPHYVCLLERPRPMSFMPRSLAVLSGRPDEDRPFVGPGDGGDGPV